MGHPKFTENLTVLYGRRRSLCGTTLSMTSDIAGPPRFPDAGAPLPPERAFVIQLRAPAAGGHDHFVGRAEHIASGAAAHFGSVRELVDFVRQVLSAGERSEREGGEP